jgi:hypothetical protein
LGMSNGTQQATFMAIENVEPNQWFNTNIQGKLMDGSSQYNTSGAYEFVTDSPQIEVYINVPPTLSLYEARLYLMSDQNSLFVNDAPLPWEPGLYGNLTGDVGGYNLDAIGYRGVSYASCEHKGQNLLLNYNSSGTGKTLYHLVLVGQVGSENLNLLVKTQFGNACLLPTADTIGLTRVSASNTTKISYLSNATDLTSVVLRYTTDNWNSSSEMPMSIQNRTVSATIPRQNAGTLVQYQVVANDTLKNTLTAQGNFTVKQFPMLNITVASGEVQNKSSPSSSKTGCSSALGDSLASLPLRWDITSKNADNNAPQLSGEGSSIWQPNFQSISPTTQTGFRITEAISSNFAASIVTRTTVAGPADFSKSKGVFSASFSCRPTA